MRAPFSSRASFSFYFVVCVFVAITSRVPPVNRHDPRTPVPSSRHRALLSFLHTFHHVFLPFVLFIRSLCFISDLPGSTSRQIGGRRRARQLFWKIERTRRVRSSLSLRLLSIYILLSVFRSCNFTKCVRKGQGARTASHVRLIDNADLMDTERQVLLPSLSFPRRRHERRNTNATRRTARFLYRLFFCPPVFSSLIGSWTWKQNSW